MSFELSADDVAEIFETERRSAIDALAKDYMTSSEIADVERKAEKAAEIVTRGNVTDDEWRRFRGSQKLIRRNSAKMRASRGERIPRGVVRRHNNWSPEETMAAIYWPKKRLGVDGGIVNASSPTSP